MKPPRQAALRSKILQKLEQSVLSLAAGLAKLVNLASNLQGAQPSQVQDLLSSISGGKITQADIDQLLAQISVFNQNVDASNNPLLLSASQQASLLSQMLQNMIQNQQVVLAPTAGDSTSDQIAAIGSGASSALSGMSIQFDFTDTELIAYQQSGGQQSLLAMDLQTMSLQSDSAFSSVSSGSTTQLPGNAVDQLTQLLADLQVQANPTPLVSVSTTADSSALSADLQQNFKNLVQMLSTAGAGQVVLSSLINQQKDLTTDGLKQAFNQTPALADQLNSLQMAVEAAAVQSVESTFMSGQNPADTNPSALPLNAGGSPDDLAGIQAQLTDIDNMVARMNLTASQGYVPNTNAQNSTITPSLIMDQLIAEISQFQPAAQQQASATGQTIPVFNVPVDTNTNNLTVFQIQPVDQSLASVSTNTASTSQSQVILEQYLTEISQFQAAIQMQAPPAGNTSGSSQIQVPAATSNLSIQFQMAQTDLVSSGLVIAPEPTTPTLVNVPVPTVENPGLTSQTETIIIPRRLLPKPTQRFKISLQQSLRP